MAWPFATPCSATAASASSSGAYKTNMRSGRRHGRRKTERTGTGKRTLAAATVGAVLAFSSSSPHSPSPATSTRIGCVFAAAANTDTGRQKQMDRLPQRRVRTPQRAVQYPADHPLTRHLSRRTAEAAEENNSEDGGAAPPEDDEETSDEDDPEGEDKEEEDDDYAWSTTEPTTSPAPTAFPTSPPIPIPEPIRIVPLLTAATKRHLTKSQQSYLLGTVMQPAINAWSDVISLIRVQGNLTLDRNQLWDGISCGPGVDSGPSALVPEEHFDDYRGDISENDNDSENKNEDDNDNDNIVNHIVSKGVPNADLVVYIELGFRSHVGESHVDEDSEEGTDNAVVDDSSNIIDGYDEYNNPGTVRGSNRKYYKDAGFEPLLDKDLLLDPSTTSDPWESPSSESGALSTASSLNGTRPSLTDLLIDSQGSATLISSKQTGGRPIEHPKCSPAYLASAAHCSTDQFDRPTHGMIHFCVDPQTFFTSESEDIHDLQMTRLTAMHEIGHILGFNLQSLAHFRERDGTPRTPRVASDTATSNKNEKESWVVGDVADVKVECTGILPPGNDNNRKKRRRRAVIPLPSESTLRFRTIRGGVRVADVVLPSVRAVVRNHFSCDSLDGAELEGDHWIVERQQDPILVAATPVPEGDHGSSESDPDQRKMRQTEQIGGSADDEDGRDPRGDYDYLKQQLGDQDSIASILDQNIQYYNDDTDVGSCIEDHWSRRVFKTDLMNPVITNVPLPRPESYLGSSEAAHSLLPTVSPLTLAFFADSGWYDVDVSRASPSSGPWGRGAGCPFVNEKCVMANGKIRATNSGLFCNDPQALPYLSSVDDAAPATSPSRPESESTRGSLRERESLASQASVIEWTGCTPDMLRKATCDLARYTKSLPEEYAYFSSSSSFFKIMTATEASAVGGVDPSLDYCPVYDSDPHEEISLCTSPKAARHSRVKAMEAFGSDSRCVTGRIDGRKAALCLPVACVLSDRSLRVKVDGQWNKCKYAGQVLDMWPRGDKVICPDIRLVCPTFWCPQDCLGAGKIDEDGNTMDGICDAETGRCMCQNVSFAPSTAPSTQATPAPTGSDDEAHLSENQATETIRNDNTAVLPEGIGAHNDDDEEEETVIPYIPCERPYSPRSDMTMPWLVPPLSDYYVKSAKELVDTPVDIFTRTFRVFSSMDAGDVIGFLAVSVVVVLGAGIGSMGVVKVYKRKRRGRGRSFTHTSAARSNRRRSTANSALLLRRAHLQAFGLTGTAAPRFRLNLGGTGARPTNSIDQRRQRSSRRRPRNSFRANKDKAVATILVDLRVNDPTRKRRQRQRQLLLQRQQRRRREIQERVRHLPARVSSQTHALSGESVVRRSDLPPLPEGSRVVAVVGALFLDDIPEEEEASLDNSVGNAPSPSNADDFSSVDASDQVTDTTMFGDATLSSSGGSANHGRDDASRNVPSSFSDAGTSINNDRESSDEMHLADRQSNNVAFEFSSATRGALRKRCSCKEKSLARENMYI